VNRNDINLEYDSQTQEYDIIWEPIVISTGKTKVAALEDLREAAHFGVGTLIDLKLKDIKKED
jgi:predicted RNase H-like HicB family nuclease